VSRDARRPALHALLQLQALLGQLAMLRREGICWLSRSFRGFGQRRIIAVREESRQYA
jgi:hypothetical protein